MVDEKVKEFELSCKKCKSTNFRVLFSEEIGARYVCPKCQKGMLPSEARAQAFDPAKYLG